MPSRHLWVYKPSGVYQPVCPRLQTCNVCYDPTLVSSLCSCQLELARCSGRLPAGVQSSGGPPPPTAPAAERDDGACAGRTGGEEMEGPLMLWTLAEVIVMMSYGSNVRKRGGECDETRWMRRIGWSKRFMSGKRGDEWDENEWIRRLELSNRSMSGNRVVNVMKRGE